MHALNTRILSAHMQHMQTSTANLKRSLNPSFILPPISPLLLQSSSQDHLQPHLPLSLFIFVLAYLFHMAFGNGIAPSSLCVKRGHLFRVRQNLINAKNLQRCWTFKSMNHTKVTMNGNDMNVFSSALKSVMITYLNIS